jgi:WS/DGAT/MGAT family acyltransferase
VEAPEAEAEPAEPVNLLGQGITAGPRYLARVVRALPRLLPNVEHSPLTALPGMREIGRAASAIDKAIRRESGVVERSTVTPPRTSFNTVVSAHRRFAFGDLSLDEVKAVKNAHRCTVNDVVMAMCAGALRTWLIAHDELPDGPLVAQVPVSVRTPDELGTYGNKIGIMSPPLHVDEPDPLRRLHLTHESMKAAKELHGALPATLLRDASEFIPPALFARAARIGLALGARGTPIWNVVISNVPGPPIPLYFAGALVEAMYPVSVITDGLGMNITLFSYRDRLNFGIIVDRDTVPDVWDLIGWLGDALDELVATIPDGD